MLRSTSPYAQTGKFTAQSLNKQREQTKWRLISPASSPIIVEAFHLMNFEERKLVCISTIETLLLLSLSLSRYS